MTQAYLGIDIGTSGCKLALFDSGGAVLYIAMEEYPSYYPASGYVEQAPDDWWDAVCRGLRSLWKQGAQPSSIAAVGIAGQSWSAVPVDKDGAVLAHTPIWMDTRAMETCEAWNRRLLPECIFAVSKNPFSPTYTLPKVLYWIENNPSLIKKAQHILQSNAFIVYRLTGRAVMDYSMAYGWHNFDQAKLCYDSALTAEFNIPERFLIDPLACEAVAGYVTEGAARQTGLLSGTPVVAGGLDAACGTFGVGVVQDGQTQEQGGQAGGMSICVGSPLAHPQLILSTHVVPGKWLLQGGTVGGGASLKWFAGQLGAARIGSAELAREGPDIFPLLSGEAQTAPVGSNGIIFLPYLSGERSPIWDSNARGMYFGLKYSHSHADFVRATMEGVAYALRHNMETAADAGARILELRGMGGSANSHIWTQIKADVTGLPMVIPASDTATTRGAAMLAMIGVGCYRDHQSAVEAIVKIERVQKPNPENHEKYKPYYDIYRQLYPRTADCMKQLSAIG